jgi:phospholipid/cholesterol/gamma-HCH transport system substrate-binding protein
MEGSDRIRNGLMAIVIVVLVIGVGQSFSSVPVLFAQPVYYAQFHDAAGIHTGDVIRMAGVNVGQVRDVQLDGNKVVVEFTLGATTIGAASRAAIRTDTILGRRNIDIEPRPGATLAPGGMLPLAQTTTPYQLYDAFTDITNAASGWDIDAIRNSLNALSQTIDQTAPHLSAAFDGIKRFSAVIASRDEQFKKVLANARTIASVLGDRSEQINQLVLNANELLAAVNERGRAIIYLLEHAHAVETQVQGLIADNPNLHHVLQQLRTVTDMLDRRKQDFADTLGLIARFAASLGEGLASGPFFKGMVANLLPGQFLQPFIDAAFKKRGLDPEQFWRSAGLPAFRFPDPNGTRLPNGAPPPAPPVVEGTLEHPGPAVGPGSPCSYTPPNDGLPRPADPLPCAALNTGPFGGGPDAPTFPAPVDVRTSPPKPGGLPPTPGIPVAGLPGQPPPNLPGTPVPLPPSAPPGARIPPPPTGGPPIVVPPAPPPPPGPGPQLPVAPLPGNPPYLPPGSQQEGR